LIKCEWLEPDGLEKSNGLEDKDFPMKIYSKVLACSADTFLRPNASLKAFAFFCAF